MKYACNCLKHQNNHIFTILRWVNAMVKCIINKFAKREKPSVGVVVDLFCLTNEHSYETIFQSITSELTGVFI